VGLSKYKMKKKIVFESCKGNKLVGILSKPPNNKKTPVIILCHGFSSSKESKTYVRLERELNKRGLASFRFDFYGHGESGGKFEDITVSESVDDILSAISLLKTQGYAKIGLVGSSFGGISSIMVASRTDDLFVLVLRAPVSDFEEVELLRRGKDGLKDWKKRGYAEYFSKDRGTLKLNYSFFEDLKDNNGYKAAKNIKVPTLIVHGDNDEAVPVKQSKKTSTLIKNCKLEIIEGADHRFSDPKHFETVIGLIVSWIVKHS
jgi:uncharacterized protein